MIYAAETLENEIEKVFFSFSFWKKMNLKTETDFKRPKKYLIKHNYLGKK